MRYIFLVILNLPVILLALMNILTQYKLGKISRNRFKQQIFLWIIILLVLLASFPLYNLTSGKPIFDSHTLSLLDILQTTAIIYMIYSINDHRRKIEQNERTIRDLHQEVSIKLSEKNGKS